MVRKYDPFEYIRNYYGVPAKKGQRVLAEGRRLSSLGQTRHWLIMLLSNADWLACQCSSRVMCTGWHLDPINTPRSWNYD